MQHTYIHITRRGAHTDTFYETHIVYSCIHNAYLHVHPLLEISTNVSIR